MVPTQGSWIKVKFQQTGDGYSLPFPIHLLLADKRPLQPLGHAFRRMSREHYDPDASGGIEVALFGHPWRWPSFDQWHEYFDRVDYFPAMWDDVIYIPDPPSEETIGALQRFAACSVDARRLAVRLSIHSRQRPATLAVHEVKRRAPFSGSSLSSALEELETAGYAKTDVGIEHRLSYLSKAQLSELLEQHDLKKSGNKAALTRRLAESVPDSELMRVFPPAARDDLIWIGSIPDEVTDEAFVQFEVAKLRLLEHTASFSIRSAEQIAEYMDGYDREVQVEILGVDDNCPICSSHHGKICRPDDGPFPPFHPGCRCAISPHIPEYSELFR